jgi:hypothetical protein
LLLETSPKSGFGDHTSLMIHKYSRHAELMSRMPKVDVDFRVCEGKFGRGLEAMRTFHAGEVIGSLLLNLKWKCEHV